MKELLGELFDHYYDDIFKYLYRLSHDASISEDLTSEVFLEVVKSIATFRGESDIKTWLFSIARHKWYAYLRKKNTQIQAESIHELYESDFVGLSNSQFTSDVEQIIHTIIENEPETTKNVFQLRIDGFSYFEISEKLNISESSARVLFFRVKAKIKKHLEKEGLYYE